MAQDNAQKVANGPEGTVVRPYPFPATPGRSANMKANRRTDTKPELALRAALHARGYRYRKDFRLDLPLRRVRPDIAFTRRKVAVFIDGCFWHACPAHGTSPKSNEWYWSPKLARNVERDRAADEALAQEGWTVVRLWEHVTLDDAIALVIAAVGGPKACPAAVPACPAAVPACPAAVPACPGGSAHGPGGSAVGPEVVPAGPGAVPVRPAATPAGPVATPVGPAPAQMDRLGPCAFTCPPRCQAWRASWPRERPGRRRCAPSR